MGAGTNPREPSEFQPALFVCTKGIKRGLHQFQGSSLTCMTLYHQYLSGETPALQTQAKSISNHVSLLFLFHNKQQSGVVKTKIRGKCARSLFFYINYNNNNNNNHYRAPSLLFLFPGTNKASSGGPFA